MAGDISEHSIFSYPPPKISLTLHHRCARVSILWVKMERKKKETGTGWGSAQRRGEGCQEDRN